MDRFGLLSHHHHHHKSQGQGGGKEESTVLVLDPSIAFLYCFFLLAIVMAAICFNFRRRSQAVRVDLRLVQVKRPCDKTFLMTNDLLTGAARAPASFLYEAFLRGAAAKVWRNPTGGSWGSSAKLMNCLTWKSHFQQKFDIGGIQSNRNEIESLFHPCLFCVEIILLFIFFQCLKVSGPQDAKVSRSRISHKFKENMWRYIVVYPLCAAGGLTDLIRQSKDEQPDADEEIHPVFTLRAIIIIHLNEYCKRIIWDQFGLE